MIFIYIYYINKKLIDVLIIKNYLYNKLGRKKINSLCIILLLI